MCHNKMSFNGNQIDSFAEESFGSFALNSEDSQH